MAWARTGTVSFTSGSVTVTGVGTQFLVELRQGDGIRGPDGLLYEAANLVSNTQLTLGQPYAGATVANSPLWVVATQGYLQKTGDELRDWTNKAGLLVDSESLQALSEVVGTANAVPIFNSIDEMSTFTLSAIGLAIATAADATAVKTQLALNNVNNTPDASKPISAATQAALDTKMRNAITNSVDSTTDLNNITAAGPHNQLVGTGNPNIPEAALFYPFNFRYTGGSWCQILFPYGVSNSGNIWWRTFYVGNSAPSPWRRALASSELVTAISDTTANRIMTVGYHGLGGSSMTGGAINTIKTSGFYGYASTNVIGGWMTNANVLEMRWGPDTTWASQLALQVAGNEIAYRSLNATLGNSSPWTRLLGSRNVTLPVSNDLNVSGGIMEVGSNANGMYWKFANGLLICEPAYKVGYTAGTAVSLPFAHAFLSTSLPTVSCSIVAGSSWDTTAAWYATETQGYFFSNTTAPGNGIRMVAIGRWY